ncbi:hypothetical protein ACHAXS_012049 [Conticribra weissflogii]
MSNMQDRLIELNIEIERVLSCTQNEIFSDLLHGTQQKFTKLQLKRKLQDEHMKCWMKISHWRAGIINMDREIVRIEADVDKHQTRLNERKAALLQFDKQCAAVTSMKCIVSKDSAQVQLFYFTRWRSRAKALSDMRTIFDSFARSIRRKMYIKAWKKWLALVPIKVDDFNNRADGIGGVLLNATEAYSQQILDDTLNLIGNIAEIRLNFDDGDANERLNKVYPRHHLCKQDRDLMTKGDFMFNAEHFESALEMYSIVVDKMGSRDYFSSISEVDAKLLYAEVNGKIGQVHMKNDSWDVSIVYFFRQLELLEEIKSTRGIELPLVSVSIGLGTCYYEKCDYEYAYESFQKSLELSLSVEDVPFEILSYTWLQKCCERLNRHAEVASFAERLDKFRDTRAERVGSALKELVHLKQRLIDITAKNSRVLHLEAASPNLVLLQSNLIAKKQQLREVAQKSAKAEKFLSSLQELEEDIVDEIEKVTNSKKNRVISKLVQGSAQEINTSELLIRLTEKLRLVREKQSDTKEEISNHSLAIHNTQDDIAMIEEDIDIENRPLMRRVLENRKYRCCALNASNVASDDIKGIMTGSEIIALSEGKEAYIYNTSTGKSEAVFLGDEEGRHMGEVSGHTSTITTLYLYENRLYSGSTDCRVMAWDISTKSIVFTCRGHSSTVTCLCADDLKLVSGSADKSWIIWNKNDGTLIRRVNGHARGVKCLKCGPSWAASASYGTVFCWSITREKESDNIIGVSCSSRFSLPSGSVTALQYGALDIVIGDSLGKVSIWWVKTGELLKSVQVHDGPVTSIQVDATKAVTCGLDMTVQVIDIINGEVLQILRGHKEPILTTGFDRRMIVSISVEGQVREWSWANSRVGSEEKNENVEESGDPCVNSLHRINRVESNQRTVKTLPPATGGKQNNDTKDTSSGGTLLNRMIKKYSKK